MPAVGAGPRMPTVKSMDIEVDGVVYGHLPSDGRPCARRADGCPDVGGSDNNGDSGSDQGRGDRGTGRIHAGAEGDHPSSVAGSSVRRRDHSSSQDGHQDGANDHADQTD